MELLKLYNDTKDASHKRVFAENYIRMIDEQHKDIPLEHKINFLHKAAITGANPVMGEIFLIPRSTKQKNPDTGTWESKTIGVVQFSYHFFLSSATEGDELDRFWVDIDTEEVPNPMTKKREKQMVAIANVLKKGSSGPIVYKARWEEFVQKSNYGVMGQWKTKPCLMLEKCAIANCMRWAFPRRLQGMYVQEEMGKSEKSENGEKKQITAPVDVAATVPAPAPRPAPAPAPAPKEMPEYVMDKYDENGWPIIEGEEGGKQ